ncbi:MAG: murein peptide amidase [Propionibacteriaceae bacterium]|jgi:hypothetical protein|nr:hypothetical protein [Propionibacteriaceae bacterium]MDX6323431.1 murein peptide amidase [Propionibacteriaceae bacterium]
MHRRFRPVRRASAWLTVLLLGVALALPPPGRAGAAPAVPPAAPVVLAMSAAAAPPRYGQRSGAVRALQNRLIAAGLLKAELNTGYFGSKTRSAVQRLQRRSGLSPSGRVTAATAKALDRAVAKVTGPRSWYHRERIGTSSGGRAITAYRAGQPGKPVVVVVATMHGEENFGQYVARGLLEGRPITGVDLWVVPVLNPDGLAKDRLGGRQRRPQPELPAPLHSPRQLRPAGVLGQGNAGGHALPGPDGPAVRRLLAPAADRGGQLRR